MLSPEDNALLTRVAPGEPMGQLMRQYWLPILLATELPEPDGPPLRVRLLGEDLVAFRDTAGRVGLLAEHCAHRGASLYFGRNEECGLRCVYHGWKFDADGNCVDMPSEPPESTFKDRIHQTAYRCLERGGVVWAYLGARPDPPPLPDLEWSLVPEAQRYLSKRYEACNWAQALEGGIDSSHSGFLHSLVGSEDYLTHQRRGMRYKTVDKHPSFETVDTDYGVLIGARRDAAEEGYYWRITQFLMPFYTILPPYGESPLLSGHAWVPLDDENTMAWTVTWHPLRPLAPAELARFAAGPGLHLPPGSFLAPTVVAGSAWRPTANRDNDYRLDRSLQNRLYFGVAGVALQDQAVQESMGPIYNRSKEHLGTSDGAIIQVRRRLLDAARGLRDGRVTPPGVEQAAAYRVRSAGVVLPRDVPWVEGAGDHLAAPPDVHLASV
jgi:nitrite reductase/ring-hydroxylating ferredoxin subunit